MAEADKEVQLVLSSAHTNNITLSEEDHYNLILKRKLEDIVVDVILSYQKNGDMPRSVIDAANDETITKKMFDNLWEKHGRGKNIEQSDEENLTLFDFTSDNAAAPLQSSSSETPKPKHPDFTITDELIDLGGDRTKFRNNIRALRTLHSIEIEKRAATDDERKVLATYVGWGGLASAFDAEKDEWSKEYQELRQLVADGVISEDDYERARRSTLDAYYTSPTIVQAMYQLLDRLGFKGGRILEPSMGVGNFFGMMPTQMANISERTGIEIDRLSGRMAQILYPNARIHIRGFEEFKTPDASFDLAIGNVPFGDILVVDGNYSGNREFVKKQIHNYFFAKALDKVRDGGLVMFITSSGTLNAAGNKKMREYIADKADFIGAVRLPNTAFKANAGTEVTSDIIVLRKRPANQEPNHVADFTELIQTDYIGREGSPLKDNEYFVLHPDHVLGTYTEDTLFGNRLAVEADGRDLSEALAEVITRFSENIYQQSTVIKQEIRTPALTAEPIVYGADELDEYNFADIDGEIYQKIDGQMLPVSVGANKDRIKGLIQIRDAAEKVLYLQRKGAGDHELQKAQLTLNQVYDAFQSKNGILNEPSNIRAFKDDVMGSALVRSLERNIRQEKKGTKTLYFAEKEAIFTERTVQAVRGLERVDSPQEALIVSLFEKGKVDWEFMSDIIGLDEHNLKVELTGLVFENPASGRWETADQYLSGNVREKLRIAEQAAAEDVRYQENVEALAAIQPEDLTPAQITVRLGAPWIPPEDISSFVNNLLEVNNKVEVHYEPLNATWSVKERNKMKTLNYNTKNTEEYGIKNRRGRNVTALDLVEDALNLKIPTVTYKDDDDRLIVDIELTNEARAKQKQIQDIFQDWIWSEEDRAARLAHKYNEAFNSIRLREYDGEAIYGKGLEENFPIPGLNVKYKLRPHQKNAVWRVAQGGNALLAHVVGAGKTLEMIVSGMEMKRLGLVNKPMYVVPNHLLDQWEHEFLDAYPGAKLLKISNEGIPAVGVRRMKGMSDEEYSQRLEENRVKRRIALNKIVVGNYDAILITHSTFQKLPMSPETVREHIREQIMDVEAAIRSAALEEGSRRTVKQLEKTKANLEARLKENLDEEKKDVAIPFEELGVDQIFVDEAHLFKNLKFHTKMTRVAGLPQTNSKRAQDMFLKTQWLTKYTGRGVVFATGTPISNTMAEMFTMQRYLQMETLRSKGLAHFDAWAALFGEAVTGIEMDATGKFKQKTRFARFHNVAELMQMFRTFADIKTADMLNLPVPQNVIRDTIVAPMSEEQHTYLMDLAERAKAIKEGRVTPDEDNYLKLTGDGRKSALDIRLVDRTITWDNPDSKTNYCVEKVHEIWERTEEEKLTQLIFLDLGTPKKKEQKDDEKEDDNQQVSDNDGEEFSQVYDDIKSKLIRKGIPDYEIAFIHDAKTDKQRFDLFEKVRSGDVRVLIGSTEKMGAGMNVQTRLKALHHLDAPWRPADVEQREGRIIRQGNINDSVEIYTYTTEGSFDAIMWDTLKRKATFIAQVMNGTANVRSLEDVEELVLGYAQVAAVTSGNPLFLEKHEIDQKVLELQSLKTSYERNKRKYQDEILKIPQDIKKREERVAGLHQDLLTRKETKGDLFEAEIMGVTYTDRGEAGAVLNDLYNLKVDNMNYGKMESIGHFAGFELLMGKGMGNTHFLKGAVIRGFEKSHSPVGTIQRMEHCIRKIEEDIQENEEKIAYAKVRLEDLQKLVSKPFDKVEELKRSLERQAELIKLLTELDGDNNAVAESENEEGKTSSPKKKRVLFEILAELGKGEILDPQAVRHANMMVDDYFVKEENNRKLLMYQLEGERMVHTVTLETEQSKGLHIEQTL
ncbi:SNF2-related protein [Brevibacillus centrosporus]|uniref:SNF2-related protein n=1 Tax=Brevibacillus centrosporus TaxID=54910 RepID=UPI003D1C125C